MSLTDEEMAQLYEHPDCNTYGCLVNQYLVVRNSDNEVVDKLKWNGDTYSRLSYKTISNTHLGKIKPLNMQQELAFDMIQDSNIKIKVLDGKAGSGKDFCFLTYCFELLRSGAYERIVWVRNNIEVKNTNSFGALPGTLNEKALWTVMPLADIIGGQEAVMSMIDRGALEIAPLNFLRGRNLQNCIVYCTESEQFTSKHMQTILERCGNNTSIFINGDVKQADSNVFDKDNGLRKCIDRLSGNHLFGYVHFEKTERSEIAELASLLED